MKNKEIKYPVMMESIENGLVVKFMSKCVGTVQKITDLCANNYVGEFYSRWYPATDGNIWRVYNPTSLSKPIESISEETAKQLGDLMAKELLHMNNTYYEKELNDYAKLLANRLIVSPPITPAHEKALKTIDILTERIRVLSGMLTEYMTKEVLDNNNKKEIEAGARLNTQYMVDLVNCRSASTVPPIHVDNNSALHSQIGGDHYKNMAIQPVEFIHKNGLNFCQGNIIKYICRYRNKGGLEDLKKVLHYTGLLMEMEYGGAK